MQAKLNYRHALADTTAVQANLAQLSGLAHALAVLAKRQLTFMIRAAETERAIGPPPPKARLINSLKPRARREGTPIG